MKVDLPVHKVTGEDVLLNRDDAFGLNHHMLINQLQGVYQAMQIEMTLGNARIERIAQ